MPSKYKKSRYADQDINKITKRSLKDFGELQIDKYMEGMEEIFETLADHPDFGRTFIHGTTKTEYRYYRYVSHVVYYRQRKNDIFIVRILHIKMLPEKYL